MMCFLLTFVTRSNKKRNYFCSGFLFGLEVNKGKNMKITGFFPSGNMLINSIGKKDVNKVTINNTNPFIIKNANNCDSVSFGAKRSADDFRKEYRSVYGSTPLEKEIYSIVTSEENYQNEGKSCVVYSIPKIDKYMLRVPKPVDATIEGLKEKKNKLFKDTPDVYPNRNYGQAVLQNQNKIQIVKKVPGEPHSVEQWVSRMENPDRITGKDAQNFLSQLELLSNFPQETFDKYANSVKACNKHKMDTINPNNTMIDYAKQKIGIIDLSENMVLDANTREDMIFPLIDVFLHKTFYERLDSSDRERLVSATKQIIEKCNIAADKEHLNFNERGFIQSVIQKVKAVSRNPESRLENFKKMYNSAMSLYRDDIYGKPDDWSISG